MTLFEITSKRGHYKLNEVLNEVFIDEYSTFDSDFPDSLSNSSEQVSETSQQESVKIAKQFSHSL